MAAWTLPLNYRQLPARFPPGLSDGGARPARPQATVGRQASLCARSWDDPQVCGQVPRMASVPTSPPPIITVMFYRQRSDEVNRKHFRLSFIKGSNKIRNP